MLSTLLSLFLCFSSAPLRARHLETFRSQASPSTAQTDQRGIVGLCSLLHSPASYQGGRIRVSAILVENNNKMLIDGADPSLYAPKCRNAKRTVVVSWSDKSYENSTAAESLRAIRGRSDEFQVSRANVVLLGKLSGPGKNKFGQLGWADMLFEIEDVEQAEPVAATVPWPKRIEDSYKYARKLLGGGTKETDLKPSRERP